jgi:NAD-dependent dihydropyrimidine dehydrogenase PreA subunit
VIITAVRQEDCIGCHQCDTHCPDLAIIVEKEGD